MRGSRPPLFVFAEMDNKTHTQHFAIKFDVTAKVSAERGSEPEVFFLSFFCLNHAFSLKFNYQSSNFLFLYARSTFLAPSKQSATRRERESKIRKHNSPLGPIDHRNISALFAACERVRVGRIPPATPAAAPPSSAPSVCPARPVMWQQRGVTSWQLGAGRSWVSVWIKGQVCAAERQTGHVPVPEVRHMTGRLRQIKSLVSVECSLVGHGVQVSGWMGLMVVEGGMRKCVAKVHRKYLRK